MSICCVVMRNFKCIQMYRFQRRTYHRASENDMYIAYIPNP